MQDLTNDVEERSRTLLQHAYRADASDIHFIPRKKDTLIELRIDGYLYELAILAREEAERIINHFKFLSGMDKQRKISHCISDFELYLHFCPTAAP
ncbi:ATPase, T2SS/T4P/T4SS family [Sporolactobacillus sp. CQH2019]|uniref:ATPase, T2SS/T4P/T4SS family n=1 Tax=Sporolactobacillus sp. CQH2019 TaxID=3023512 RepID=UPI0023689888|nr:ATPase, T2SS/T4P/T4SS family [Sporolactobacillus sp. CQH2019]MDD9149223.1 ATPase, T2SS/T4P/T4SS family [Sporolactobacillus sp. CQH2019]